MFIWGYDLDFDPCFYCSAQRDMMEPGAPTQKSPAGGLLTRRLLGSWSESSSWQYSPPVARPRGSVAPRWAQVEFGPYQRDFDVLLFFFWGGVGLSHFVVVVSFFFLCGD